LRREWRTAIRRVGLTLPEVAQPLVDSFWAQQAYILINADGPAIQPGSRTYERSWIRDGALTSTALLQAGHVGPIWNFINYYAPHQFDSGKVPCVVDGRGPDPVDEHDSTGQLIHLLMQFHRYTGDRELLEKYLPNIIAGVDYLDRLRQQRLTPEFRDGPPEIRRFYGLVPESISHEGYSAKPMHSYWDGFFVIRGLYDAVAAAKVLERPDLAAQWQQFLDEYRTAMYDSMRLAMEVTNVDYIPGCAELGDFDATSTAIGICPCGELGRIPEPQLTNTFERYYKFFTDRRDGKLGVARLHAVRVAAGRHVRLPESARPRPRVAGLLHGTPATGRLAAVGRGALARPGLSRVSSATFRIRGADPSFCAHCGRCWSTSTIPSGRSCWPPACRRRGWRQASRLRSSTGRPSSAS
jgi:hypothetical protein